MIEPFISNDSDDKPWYALFEVVIAEPISGRTTICNGLLTHIFLFPDASAMAAKHRPLSASPKTFEYDQAPPLVEPEVGWY